MFSFARRFMAVALVAFALTACAKNEEKKADAASPSSSTSTAPAAARVFGKEDGECFGGIVREVNAKHLASADFYKWKEKLGSKDKDWLVGLSDVYSKGTKVASAHLGKPVEQLYDSKLLTLEQLNVIEGYLKVYQETDALRAGATSAGACVNVGFTKGANLD